MSKNSNSKPVTGHWKKMYNPTYLGSWDFDPGKDIVAQIDFARLEQDKQ